MLKSVHLLLAFVAVSFSVIAGLFSYGDRPLPAFMQQLDTNNDGLIDEEESQAIRDLRAKRQLEKDHNEDGVISKDEIEVTREALRIRIEERRRAKFASIAGEDELISREEFNAIPGIERLQDFIYNAIWERLDIDGSGDVSADEFLNRLRSH